MHTVPPAASRAAQIPGEKHASQPISAMRRNSFPGDVSFSPYLDQFKRWRVALKAVSRVSTLFFFYENGCDCPSKIYVRIHYAASH
jgi:hypothetical protein